MTNNRSSSNNDDDPNVVKESVIRMMTRLAIEYKAVNLSQGFPNESPPWPLKVSLAHSVLSDGGDNINNNNDQLNQYSPPCGRTDLRSSIANYYRRFYEYDNISPEDITVTLGATEALASALRTIGRPGDKCVIFEPFHELYPSQCKLFYLKPVYVTLRPSMNNSDNNNINDNDNDNENHSNTIWTYDENELETALSDAKILILNTPHNPTGKVFTKMELTHIVALCRKYDVYLITDDIYEHMCYGNDTRHIVIPKEFPELTDKTLVCNSIGKSAAATGWRVGWCLHPPHLRDAYRGIHDQLCVMAPHPQQFACLSYLSLPDEYFINLAKKYEKRVQKLKNALVSVGFKVIFPQGAYYLFVNYKSVSQLVDMTSVEAAMYLLKNVGVACVPGDNFFGNNLEETTNKYLRFAACRSDKDIDNAIQLLEEKLL
ncbi:PLP-dependent transferase [Fragilariopsis cylindrus CCMP1102]|uniref:PLP-dependent transferase n=1 Tax=Fragilariopsis cylindrus CCMP1102 TaxID=635003 RepID=A0A1E7F4L3_9STRA|nr:PLP-dependent transferase [Fragilariopsis cylindrus CCMP1102]|eukprot:OEU13090.1 PLP-dependent transferase [Fragilariopsis cylindrus CCMP1102]